MAKYFQSFPIIDYQIGDKTKKCLDLIRRYRVPNFVYDADTFVNVFQKDNDTPEGIAFRDYDDIDKYWSFLIFNKVIDPFEEWSQPVEFIETKLDNEYPGISLFVTLNEITDLDTSTMNTKGSDASYRLNDTIKIYDDGDRLVDQGILYAYDRTTGHMKISGVETFTLSAGYYITDSDGNKKMYIARKFDYAKLGLYEFRDDNGNSVSPYRSLGGTSVIDYYIRGNDNDVLSTYDVNVITVRDDVLDLNDQLRILYYPTQSLLDRIEQSVSLFNKNRQ